MQSDLSELSAYRTKAGITAFARQWGIGHDGGKKSFPSGGNAWSGLCGLNLPFCLFRVRGNC